MHAFKTLFCASLVTAFASNAIADEPAAPENLTATILALDTAVFDAFNKCSDAAELKKHTAFFDKKVEFYHDTGGVTWTRDAMIANTARYVCGHFRRQLDAGSFRVYPIKGFGAVSMGTHRFCQFTSDTCEGLADFTMVWREKNGVWKITRVLSYGHRAAVVAQ